MVTVSVNVTLPLSAGAALLTVLVIARSACGTSTDAESLSFAGVPSKEVDDAVAVLVMAAGLVTVATT